MQFSSWFYLNTPYLVQVLRWVFLLNNSFLFERKIIEMVQLHTVIAYISTKPTVFSPDAILCGWLGSKRQLTNSSQPAVCFLKFKIYWCVESILSENLLFQFDLRCIIVYPCVSADGAWSVTTSPVFLLCLQNFRFSFLFLHCVLKE